MNTFQPSQQVSLNKINDQEISTVLLPRFENEVKVWETCIFFADGSSDVQSRYVTEADAIAGHNRYIINLLQKNNI